MTYALFLWNSALFSFGTYSAAAAPTMAGQDRRLTMFGLILFGYSAFALMRAWSSWRDSPTQDDETQI